MRAVIQRTSKASVTVNSTLTASIGSGLLVLLGITDSDEQEDLIWISRKIVNLRIFADAEGIMNRSLLETGGDAIVVSQFTLYAQVKKGNRPSYIQASGAAIATPLYNSFIEQIESDLGKKVGTGIFGADMKVELINDGPVTIVLDSKKRE